MTAIMYEYQGLHKARVAARRVMQYETCVSQPSKQTRASTTELTKGKLGDLFSQTYGTKRIYQL